MGQCNCNCSNRVQFSSRLLDTWPFTDGEPTNACAEYDGSDEGWAAAPPMGTARAYHGVAVVCSDASSACKHSITASLSSVFDSGAKSRFLLSVIGYYYYLFIIIIIIVEVTRLALGWVAK